MTADIGIIVITTDEIRAVRKWISSESDSRTVVLDDRYYYGAVATVQGADLRIVATQATVQGNLSVVSAFHALTSTARPKLVVLLGTCGSISEEAHLGDVVLAQDVIYYEPRSDNAKGPHRRGRAFAPTRAVRNAINHFVSEENEPAVLARPGDCAIGDPTFRVLQGPIGTGESVVKYRDAEVRKWLKSFNEKTLVLGTEAGGVASAFYEEGEAHNLKGYIVLRGVSDHADKAKNDLWKEAACANAVTALQRVLMHVGPHLAA